MKILVVSDTHGNTKNLFELLDLIKPIDMLIHCGDVGTPIEAIEKRAECQVYAVYGNNDYLRSSEFAKELIIDAGKHRIFITHGNYYQVNYSMAGIVQAASNKGVDIVTFGHTHVPHNEIINGILYFGPGSIAYPRQSDRRCSYGIIDIDDNRKDPVQSTICYWD